MGGRPDRQIKDIRQRAQELSIRLPDSDDLPTLQIALRVEVAKRLKNVRVNSRLHYNRRPWKVVAINPAPEGQQGKVYTLRTIKGITQIEVSDLDLLRGMR